MVQRSFSNTLTILFVLFSVNLYSQSKGVDPLLTTYWAQACYYNDSCPEDPNGSCGHARAGCGATAMAQILKFFNFPENGIGFHSFYHPTYGNISANFENTYYDWPTMPNVLNVSSLPDEISAVATLMFHCGVAVEMDYAYNASYSGTTSIRNAFPDFFGYASTAQLLNKSHFTDSVWKVMLRNELDNQRPVFYGISSGTGGHFIVIDGYTDDGYFHCNWGNGVAAGYDKLLSELSTVQEAIIGLQPDTCFCDSLATFVARQCRFDDGSGRNNYPSDKTCKYLISPPNASAIALFFSKFKTVSGFDYLRVFDGNTTNAPLIGEFSGTNLPPHLISSTGDMLLEFTTNDPAGHKGWEVSYSAEIPGVISGLYTLTDTTGIFDDGSGASNYTSHTDVYWLINPPEASSITLSFNSFSTEFSCDYLRVYNGDNTSPENLLGVFSGNGLPTELTANSGKMLLHFNTDFSTTRPGWEVEYTAVFEKTHLDLKVFLEGPFEGTEMNTGLNPAFIPLSQPFAVAPWNYFGNEMIDPIPNNDIVDWVLVELRETPYGADSATADRVTARKPAFLLNDGSIVNSDGISNLYFPHSSISQLFVVIRHRNHLDIMSSVHLTETGGVYTYDFTTGSSQVYGGATGYIELTPDTWGMVSGDANANGQVDTNDKTDEWDNFAGLQDYLPGDLNMDSQLNNKDKNEYWLPNQGKASQVPE